MASPSRRTTRVLLVPATALVLVAGSALGASSGAAAAAPRPGSLDPGLGTTGHRVARVVVSGRVGADAQVRAAVLRAGGAHLRPLSIVHGVSAAVPSEALGSLATAAGVTAVTADRAVHLTGNSWDDALSASPYVWTSQAASTWQQTGNTGAGVGIAVLDTGVSAVQDLSGRLMQGPDLSGEGNNAVDSFGHGTVMAGIAAGDGKAAGASPRTGVAPGANVISVKVAGANGATDVSTVLAGLSWVGAFKDTYNIKVLNLSWGVPSTQDPSIDPIDYAVERLWGLGVTVVVAAGNSGPSSGTILKPGDDPLVLTVGAYDDKADARAANDVVPAWSSQGPTAQGRAKPDLVAPGRTIIATRSPGSTIETTNPNALVGTAYIKGSGSSEATAVTSGAAALLLGAHPTWTPDQVKYALTSTASRIAGVATTVQGAGRIQISAAVNTAPGQPVQQVSSALGTGSLAAARGAMSPVSITCNGQTKVLNDETTTWCAPWDSSAWTSSAWTSSAWTSSAWTSSAWTSSAWTSSAWTSSAWTSSAWTSSAWTSSAWTSSAWTSSAWTSDSYDDGTAAPAPADGSLTGFLTAFYGGHPKHNRHVNGETSEAAHEPQWHEMN
jgi:serine protease AprX